MLDAHREIFKGLEKKIARIFSYLPFSPNQYTISTIFFAFFSFYFLFVEKIVLAILFFMIAAFLDLVDGAVARYKNIATKKGAYLDTIVDRFVEGILIFGILFLPLPKIFLESYVWIFLIFFGSLMTTYSKAAAKEKGLVEDELKGGLMSRGERLILIIFSLIVGIFDYTLTVYFLIAIALLSNFTVIQRVFSALKKNQQS